MRIKPQVAKLPILTTLSRCGSTKPQRGFRFLSASFAESDYQREMVRFHTYVLGQLGRAQW